MPVSGGSREMIPAQEQRRQRSRSGKGPIGADVKMLCRLRAVVLRIAKRGGDGAKRSGPEQISLK